MPNHCDQWADDDVSQTLHCAPELIHESGRWRQYNKEGDGLENHLVGNFMSKAEGCNHWEADTDLECLELSQPGQLCKLSWM